MSNIQELELPPKKPSLLNPLLQLLCWLICLMGVIPLLAGVYLMSASQGAAGFLVFLGSIVAIPGAIGAIRLRRKRKTGGLPKWLREARTYGVAGDLSSAKGTFSQENISAGEAGEKKTAKMLSRLEGRAGVRVFHGLAWPGSKNADIDHAVIQDNRIALIDSKNWAGVKHRMNADGSVVSFQSTGGTNVHQVRFHNAVAAVQQMFPKAEVTGYIAVHRTAPLEQHTNAPLALVLSKDIEAVMRRDVIRPSRESDIDVSLMTGLRNMLKPAGKR